MRRLADPYVQWNWDWNVDAAIRYSAVGDRIAGSVASGAAVRICDVGCGTRGGLSSYVQLPVVGVDIAFAPGSVRRFHLCSPVAASGHALPFAYGTFDVVVCLDVLEHVPAERRPLFINELFRIAGRQGWIFVGAPCGAPVRELEVRANELYWRRTGHDHPWLSEHLANEVLTREQMEDWLSAAADAHMGRFEISAIPNMSLRAWRVLHPIWQHPVMMHFQRVLFQPWVRWLRAWSGPPSYRWIWSVKAAGSGDESGH